MCFKDRFTATPNLDSDGHDMADARCRGCTAEDMCPRSGHCERYDSPLRQSETDVLYKEITGCNPKGWQEVDGVKLPSVSTWAQLDQPTLDRVHGLWVDQRIEPMSTGCDHSEQCGRFCACAARAE